MCFDCAEAFVARSVNEPPDSGLHERARAHSARLYGRVNDCISQSVVAKFARSFAQRNYLRVRRRVAVRPCSIASDRQKPVIIRHDASANGNFIALSGFNSSRQSLAHPSCVPVLLSLWHRMIARAFQSESSDMVGARRLSSKWPLTQERVFGDTS